MTITTEPPLTLTGLPRFQDWAEQQLADASRKDHPVFAELLASAPSTEGSPTNYFELLAWAQEIADTNADDPTKGLPACVIAIISAGILTEQGHLKRDELLVYVAQVVENYIPPDQAGQFESLIDAIRDSMSLEEDLNTALEMSRQPQNSLYSWLAETGLRAVAGAVASQPTDPQLAAHIRRQHSSAVKALAAKQAAAHRLATQITEAKRTLDAVIAKGPQAPPPSAEEIGATRFAERRSRQILDILKAADTKHAEGRTKQRDDNARALVRKLEESGLRVVLNEGQLDFIHIKGKPLKLIQEKLRDALRDAAAKEFPGRNWGEILDIVNLDLPPEVLFTDIDAAALVYVGHHFTDNMLRLQNPLYDLSSFSTTMILLSSSCLHQLGVDMQGVVGIYDPDEHIFKLQRLDQAELNPTEQSASAAINVHFQKYHAATSAGKDFDAEWVARVAKLTAECFLSYKTLPAAERRRNLIIQAMALAGGFGFVPQLPEDESLLTGANISGLAWPITLIPADKKDLAPGSAFFLEQFNREFADLSAMLAPTIDYAQEFHDAFEQAFPPIDQDPNPAMELCAQRCEIAYLREVVLISEQCAAFQIDLRRQNFPGKLRERAEMSLTRDWEPLVQAFDRLFSADPVTALSWLAARVEKRVAYIGEAAKLYPLNAPESPQGENSDQTPSFDEALKSGDADTAINIFVKDYARYCDVNSAGFGFMNGIRILQACKGDIKMLPVHMHNAGKKKTAHGLAYGSRSDKIKTDLEALEAQNPDNLTKVHAGLIRAMNDVARKDLTFNPFDIQKDVFDLLCSSACTFQLLPFKKLPVIGEAFTTACRDIDTKSTYVPVFQCVGPAIIQATSGTEFFAGGYLIADFMRKILSSIGAHPIDSEKTDVSGRINLRLLDFADRLFRTMFKNSFDLMNSPNMAQARSIIDKTCEKAKIVAAKGIDHADSAAILDALHLKTALTADGHINVVDAATGDSSVDPIQAQFIHSLTFHMSTAGKIADKRPMTLPLSPGPVRTLLDTLSMGGNLLGTPLSPVVKVAVR